MKRKTAKKILINDLIKGTYIKRPGWDPSGVLTKYGEITRINMTGLIVSLSKGENSANFLLDDGSANITVRIFEQLNNNIKIGDLVRIIGRIRENNNDFYIVPEAIKQISKEWHNFQQLELKLLKKISKKLPVEIDTKENVETGPNQKILNIISILDKGQGIDIEEIVNHVKIPESEQIIRNLIEEGEVFEIAPGRVKLLE